MKIREANFEDWNKLYIYYSRAYRKNHPLQNKDFWIWQYGNKKHGRAFVCLNDDEEIVGHVGASFGNNIAWIINVFLDADYRGKGILRKLYDLARSYYPLAATAANEAGLGLYRNMGWYRYHDLQRYVKINPKYKNELPIDLCRKINVNIKSFENKESHYFQQPSLKGIKLSYGSTVVSQENVGGARLVDLYDCKKTEEELWSLGYLWIDYVTSWNDMKIKELLTRNWGIDSKIGIPWRLNPIEKDYFCDITFLSEKIVDSELVVNRSFSDHGRIGSI